MATRKLLCHRLVSCTTTRNICRVCSVLFDNFNGQKIVFDNHHSQGQSHNKTSLSVEAGLKQKSLTRHSPQYQPQYNTRRRYHQSGSCRTLPTLAGQTNIDKNQYHLCFAYSYFRPRIFSCASSSDSSQGSVDRNIGEEQKHVITKEELVHDPDFKELLSDIRNDFSEKQLMNEGTSSSSDSDDSADLDVNSGVGTVRAGNNVKGDNNIAEDLQLLEVVDNDHGYDYEVANDIEEYDYKDENELHAQQIREDKVLSISLQRGENGVFDLDEFLTFLDDLGAENVVTIPIPPEANFCDHMVVASAKSMRHMTAVLEELLWVHKRKKSPEDPHLVIEGLDDNYWSAMDIGNIVLHLFFGHAREYYDIESLWQLGPENDPKTQEQSKDPYVLSAEDLFWLETADSESSAESEREKGEKTKPTADPSSLGQRVSSQTWPKGMGETDAGWSVEEPSNSSSK